jgi:hypothetical protein
LSPKVPFKTSWSDDPGSEPIEDLNLEMSTHNAVRRAGVTTIHDLFTKTQDEVTEMFARPGTTHGSRVTETPTGQTTVEERYTTPDSRYKQLRQRLDELGLLPLKAPWR